MPPPNPANQANVGFYPKRGEFEQEYDCDAEELLADMEIMDHDDPDEMSLKDEVILLYNQRLDERIARKEFLIRRNLLLLDGKRYKTKEEKELASSLKIFARFTKDPEQYERVMSLFLKERLLREVIS